MSDSLERVLREAGRMARHDSSLSTAEILRVARAARAPQRQGARHERRVLLPAGLAAAAALLVGLLGFVFLGPPSTVNAAERLKQAVEATARYQGWVRYDWHVLRDGQPDPDGQWWQQFNTLDDVHTYKEEWADWRRAYIAVPGRGEAIEYVRATNTVHVYDLNPATGRYQIEYAGRDAGLEGVIEGLQEFSPHAISVTSGSDGDLEKFTFAVPANEHEKWPAYRCDVWVDPATRLVQRIERNGPHAEPGLVVVRKLTYGPPPVRDIYELGAPRDAKVVDERQPAEVRAVFERLDRRVMEGFGDHVAVLTQSGTKYESLEVYGRAGERAAHYDFYVTNPKLPATTKPPAWPRPSVTDALALVATRRAYYVYTEDMSGARPRAWEGHYDYDERSYLRGGIRDRLDLPKFLLADPWMVRLKRTFAYWHIWPSRHELGLLFAAGGGMPGRRVELATDPKRPGLIGLIVPLPRTSDDGTVWRRTIWLDPRRDDVPVELIEQRGHDREPRHATVVQTLYTDHAQLPNGRWYPSAWRIAALDPQGNPASPDKVTHYHLRIDTTATLPDDWYGDPVPRLMALAAGPPVPEGPDAAAPASRPSATQQAADAPRAADEGEGGVDAEAAPRGASLGAKVMGAEDETQRELGLPDDVGVAIVEVIPGGSAEAAGLRAGDVVVKLGRRDLRGLHELQKALRAARPGDTLDLTVRRGRESLQLQAVLGAPGGVRDDGRSVRRKRGRLK